MDRLEKDPTMEGVDRHPSPANLLEDPRNGGCTNTADFGEGEVRRMSIAEAGLEIELLWIPLWWKILWWFW